MSVETRYTSVARALHWVIAVMIVGQIMGGALMSHDAFGPSATITLFQLHKTFGLTVLILSLVRLWWRLGHRPPALPEGMSARQRQISAATHWLFYGAMIGIPLAGWAMVSANPALIPTKLFFVVPVPHLPLPKSEALAGILSETHQILAMATMALLVLHVAAALKHHFKDRDTVLVRMLPIGKDQDGTVAAKLLTGIVAVVALVFVAVMATLPAHEEAEEPAGPPPTVAEVDDAAPVVPTGAPLWTPIAEETSVTLIGAAYGGEQRAVVRGIDLTIALDPDAPEAGGLIRAVLPLAEMDVSSTARDQLAGPDWLDFAGHPAAMFVSTEIEKLGEGTYEARGTLTVKGQEMPLTLPFSLSVDADRAEATANISLDRLALNVGGPGGGVEDLVRVEIIVAATR